MFRNESAVLWKHIAESSALHDKVGGEMEEAVTKLEYTHVQAAYMKPCCCFSVQTLRTQSLRKYPEHSPAIHHWRGIFRGLFILLKKHAQTVTALHFGLHCASQKMFDMTTII